MHPPLPTLLAKAIADAGYDLLEPVQGGWLRARSSGLEGEVWLQPEGEGVRLARSAAVATAATAELIGEPGAVYETLQRIRGRTAPASQPLLARLEQRMAALPATERTTQARQRIGQQLFREALLLLWDGRCALSGVRLPPALLRASHAKPWARASDRERLDPFNGLLLAVHFDALFDSGLASFTDCGRLLASPALDAASRSLFGLENLRLRRCTAEHQAYLAWHREHIFQAH